jgi:hypothetical protein
MLEKAIASILIGVVVGTYTERNQKSFWKGIFAVIILTLVACIAIDLA